MLQENLCDLNARLSGAGEAELPMNRFRPNIVLAGGGAAWSDDDWHSITISSSNSSNNAGAEGGESTVLQYVKPCSRCKVRRSAASRVQTMQQKSYQDTGSANGSD
jgi:uncharacterized protein YcbX